MSDKSSYNETMIFLLIGICIEVCTWGGGRRIDTSFVRSIASTRIAITYIGRHRCGVGVVVLKCIDTSLPALSVICDHPP